MAGDAPAGTVTFVFTDVESSTRLWEDAPDAMAAALERHDTIVRAAVDEHGGYVFATGGDGFAAAFPSAASAADAAVEIQRHLLAEPGDIDIRVRIGIHTGEATQRDENYFGPEVNRAARVMALAHGGQVVISDATEALIRNRVALRPLGEHRLRGLTGRTAVFQIVADGLPAEFPPLRSLGAVAGNLPEDPSSFVGREPLVDEVAGVVRTNDLVTLSGPGGVGKTRLALEVGATLTDDFPDGVWFVELAPVTDPSSVPAAIATTLGVVPKGDAEIIDTVAEAVAGRRLLLVIDNCEHVVAAAGAAVRTILGRATSLKVLATSREYLWVGGETLVPVVPLSLEGGAASDAVTLFATATSSSPSRSPLSPGRRAPTRSRPTSTASNRPTASTRRWRSSTTPSTPPTSSATRIGSPTHCGSSG